MQTVSPINYSMFMMPVHDPAKPLAQCFDEDLEFAIQCDELGFTDFWVGEHHTSTIENIVMPEIFLGKVLGLTDKMRIGAAPVCLQYHHPLHVANRLAFLDHFSHGRLNVCLGPGAIPTDNELYGIDPSEIGPRISESINMIMDIWSGDPPYNIQGDFWSISQKTVDPEFGMGVLHKPLQQPHPPIFVPCMSPNSRGLQAAAKRGFRPISHHMNHPDVLANQWQGYAEGAAAGGREADPSDWCVARNIFVADSTKEARQIARENSLGKCIQYIRDFTLRYAPTGLLIWKRNEEQTDDECNLDYFMDEVIIAGDPDSVTQQLLDLREQIGAFGTLVAVAQDWDNREQWDRSFELFAKEVVPAFNRAIGAEVG